MRSQGIALTCSAVALVRSRVVLSEPAGAWASLLAAWTLGTYLLHQLP